MNWTGYIVMTLYSFVLLVFICVQALKQIDKSSFSHRLYMIMLCTTIILLLADFLSRLEGSSGIIFAVVNLSNFLLFLLGFFLTTVWCLYVFNQLYEKRRFIKAARLLALLNGLDIVLLIVSQFDGCVYAFDSEHVYCRGPLFILPAGGMIVLVVICLFLLVINYRKIEPKYLLSFLFFPVPPLVGGIIQIIFADIPLTLSGTTLSILILYVNIQNQNINVDYLTEVFNRRNFDIYLKDKVGSAAPGKTFSAILIDLDHFKSINDTYGHSVGDHALKYAASILKSSCPDAFVARYGGDEFCVILDVSSDVGLRRCVKKIKVHLDAFNAASHIPYRLSFSSGYMVYNCSLHLSPEDFLKEIDRRMYQNKTESKKALTNVK